MIERQVQMRVKCWWTAMPLSLSNNDKAREGFAYHYDE